MKDFSEFRKQCVQSGFSDQLAKEIMESQGLTPKQIASVFQLSIRLLEEYHAWLAQD